MAILGCANDCIPRGQVKEYRPFWSPTLAKLKAARNRARCKAETSKSLQDCIELRKKQAILTQAIKSGKRDAFRTFLENPDFRKDGVKAHRFVSTLNNDGNKRQQMPIRSRNKDLASPVEIADELSKYYTKVSNIKINRAIKTNLLRAPPPQCLDPKMGSICMDDFSLSELDAALSLSKKRKAAGIDKIFPEMLINLGERAKVVILQMINLT